MDATLNEVNNLEIDGYPMLKLYPRGNKNKPITFDLERN